VRKFWSAQGETEEDRARIKWEKKVRNGGTVVVDGLSKKLGRGEGGKLSPGGGGGRSKLEDPKHLGGGDRRM